MWHKKWGCFLLRSENNYWDENYWPAMAFTFCTTFKRAINRPKTDPRLFLTIYESAVSITSPLRTITDPLKEIKIVKIDPKKFSFCSFLTLPNFLGKKNVQLISHDPFKKLYGLWSAEICIQPVSDWQDRQIYGHYNICINYSQITFFAPKYEIQMQ